MKFSKLLIVALLALPACAESVESDDVFTDGIYAELRAEATENGTHATVTLRVGGSSSNTYVMLTGDDSLSVTANGETEEMSPQNFGDRYHYTADLDATSEDTEVVFRFTRVIDDGAPDSHCILPRPMNIDVPVEGDNFSRLSDDVVITWDTSGSSRPISLSVSGDCFSGVTESFEDDPGTYTIPAGTMPSNADPATACVATVELSRTNGGALDPAFGEGGSVTCSQTRTITFRSDP
ncbi:MAG TPA: hypothetical protein VNM90_13050 [Haliangium sp.]|nr:hypothetical protein [Haliangium sp.]